MLLGILEEDEEGFYVKMFNSHWEEAYGNIFDHSSFMDEVYRLRNRDWISIRTKNSIREYLVGLSS